MYWKDVALMGKSFLMLFLPKKIIIDRKHILFSIVIANNQAAF